MNVGRIGKNKEMIGITVPKDLAAIIDERREALGWSRAKFASEILEIWRAQGCPPVSEPDRLIQSAKTNAAKSLKRSA